MLKACHPDNGLVNILAYFISQLVLVYKAAEVLRHTSSFWPRVSPCSTGVIDEYEGLGTAERYHVLEFISD